MHGSRFGSVGLTAKAIAVAAFVVACGATGGAIAVTSARPAGPAHPAGVVSPGVADATTDAPGEGSAQASEPAEPPEHAQSTEPAESPEPTESGEPGDGRRAEHAGAERDGEHRSQRESDDEMLWHSSGAATPGDR